MSSHVLRIFFGILLVVSILVPIYNVSSGLQVIAHNEYDGRFARLRLTDPSNHPSLHFGLTASELAAVSRETADAYRDAVRDGYRLGRGYSAIWRQSIALNGLLFLSGLVGLWSCRLRRQPPNQAMQRTAGSLDS
jgi:hypothetical protein